MESITYYTFEDKYSQPEYANGQSQFYRAFGVVSSINMELISRNMEGILVSYRTPAASLKKEYRSINDVTLTKVSKEIWMSIRSLIEGSNISQEVFSEYVFTSKIATDSPPPEYHTQYQNQ